MPRKKNFLIRDLGVHNVVLDMTFYNSPVLKKSKHFESIYTFFGWEQSAREKKIKGLY